MQSKAQSVDQYLAELPPDRRDAISAVRRVILDNIGPGYQEGMQYGMIGYFVPHSVYPPGYHCDPRQPLPFAGLASQKNHMSVYLMCVYGAETHERWFRQAWAATGKKLDMGKACVRFKNLDAIPLEVIGQAVARVPVHDFIEYYERAIMTSKSNAPARMAARAATAAKKPAGAKKKAAAPHRAAAKSSARKTVAAAARKPAIKKAKKK